MEAIRATYPETCFISPCRSPPSPVAALKEEEPFIAGNDLLQGDVKYDCWIDASDFDAAQELLAARAN